ncbi:MAG: hypothetical protein ABIX01_06460 [Chitinophagaceae bacterium]
MKHPIQHIKKITGLSLILLPLGFLCAQNVGIGTATPSQKLHVYNPSSNPVNNLVFIENAAAGGRAGVRLQNSVGNTASIQKISPDEGVSSSGISMRGGLGIYNDDNGPIMISNSNYAKNIYLAANGRVNLKVDGTTGGLFIRPSEIYNFTGGTETDLGFRRDTINELQSWMELRDSSSAGNIAGFMSTNIGFDGYGNRIQFGNNSYGATKVTFWTDNTSPRMFIHENGNVGIGMPTFDNPNAKLYVNGQFRLTDGTQANGRVLTTDATGLASWQTLPGSATSWTVSGNNIYNSNSGNVGIGTSAIDVNARLHIKVPSSGNFQGIKIESPDVTKGFGVSFKNPTGEWILGMNAGNFNDNRFNLYYGNNPIFTVDSAGNIGIGDFSGLGNLPTQRLEIKNGFLKVSGNTGNKTAFTITATAGNSSGHILNLSYANQASSDILIVTHNYNPPGAPAIYHNYNVGVYWNGAKWTIYNEDTSIPILNVSFNVLVIKQ